MMRFVVPVVYVALLAGCVSTSSPPAKWPTGAPYVQIDRWELAGGEGYACVVANRTISIRTLNAFGRPPIVLFQRNLSASEFRAVVDAVEDSRMLDHLGEHRIAPPEDGVIVMSDGRLDRFSFREPILATLREASVEYHNYSDDAARRVFDSVDRLLPVRYRFHEKAKRPNKAPEPTPGAVTPRATEATSK